MEPLTLSERIEGSKQICADAILDERRLTWNSKLSENTKKWFRSWLQPREGELKEKYEQRLKNLLEVMTSVPSLPTYLKATVLLIKNGLPEFHSCMNRVDFAEHDSEKSFWRALDTSIREALAGFQIA
jgi:hypothetical protein